MKRPRRFFRSSRIRQTSSIQLSKGSSISLEPLEERRLLAAIPGSVLFQITAPDTTTDWPTYLKTLDWEDQSQQDLLTDTDLDTAESLIDISAGSGQRDFLITVDVPLAVDTEQLADDLETLTQVNWADPNTHNEDNNIWSDIDLTGLDLNASDPFDPQQQTQPNDEEYLDSSQNPAVPYWHYDVLDVETAWQVTRGDGVLIEMSAPGINIAHEDLRGSLQNPDEVLDGTDTDGNGFVDDIHGVDIATGQNGSAYLHNAGYPSHDNSVIGIALAGFNNEVGITGIAGDAKGLRGISTRTGGMSTEDSVRITRYYVEEGVSVATFPLQSNGFNDSDLKDMLADYYIENDVLLIATRVPSQLLGTGDQRPLTVGGTSLQSVGEVRSLYWGPDVDVMVPQGGLWLTGSASVDGSTSNYLIDSGMSFTASQVKAIAALVLSANPTWTAEQVAAAILASADDINGSGVFTNPQDRGVLGAGRLNAGTAVTQSVPAPQIELFALPDVDGNGDQYLELNKFGLFSGYVFDSDTVGDSSNWLLYGPGPNQVFDAGLGDDVVIDITLNTEYGIGSRWLEFSIDDPSTMPDGTYQFRAKSGSAGLLDVFGVQLDGNGDGTAGDDFVAEFDYIGNSYVPGSLLATATSPVFSGEAELEVEFTIPASFPGEAASSGWDVTGIVPKTQTYTVQIDATDNGSFEQSYTVDVDYTVSMPELTFTVQASEAPQLYGTQNARVRVIGKDGISTEATASYNVELYREELNNGLVDLDIRGTSGNDEITLTGSAGNYQLVIVDADTQTTLVNESLTGITGDIIANALAGHDVLDFDSVPDRVVHADGGDGNDTISGGSLADSLVGGSGNDSILGLDGDDTILGGEGDDILSGGADIDSLDGGLGDDSIGGGDGNDSIEGGEGSDFLSGDDGDDTLDSGSGSDLVLGRVGNDELLQPVGFGGSKIFVGGTGEDSIDAVDLLSGIGLAITDDVVLSDQDLAVVWAEWKSSRTFSERVANLSGTGVGPRENGNVFLVPGTTVLRDDDADDITVGFISTWVQSDFDLDQVDAGTLVLGPFAITTIGLEDVHVTNLREAAVTAPSAAVRGEPVVFSFSAGIKPDNNEDDPIFGTLGLTPPSVEDYEFVINWGDGNTETVVGGDNVEVTHIFKDANASIDVEVTVRSSTMATELVTTHNIEVKTHEKRTVGIETVLIVGGTSANEQFLIADDEFDANGTVIVRITDADTQQETFYSDSGFAGRVIIYAQGGTDTILANLLHHRGVEGHGQDGVGIYIGSDQDDQFYGGDDADTMFGRAGNDLLEGNGSADYIVGEGGNDTLHGGLGDDAYVFGRTTVSDLGEDTLIDGTGVEDDAFDTLFFLDFGEGISINLAAATMLDVTGKLKLEYNSSLGAERVIEAVVGTPFNDTIIGNDKNNFLVGVVGDDTLQGGNGDDFLSGDLGNDQLEGGAGNDTYRFERELGTEDLGTDTILEGVGAQDGEFDTLDFQAFGEGVVVDLSNPTLSDPTIVNMANKLVLELDNSHLTANEDELIEVVIGSAFGDSITGDAAQNFLGGEGGDDTIDGGDGDDIIFGGEGDDSLLGGNGNDQLHGGGIVNPGGSDDDILEGGSGDDLYQFFREEELLGADLGSDTIVEATGGANDDFDALDFTNFGEAVTVDIITTGTAVSMAGDLVLTLTNPEGIEGVIGTAFGDTITGNNRDNVLVGAAGADSISGGLGDDILIGGLGADTLDGGADDDLLMAGYLDFGDDAISALADIQAGWASVGSYSDRVNNILSGLPDLSPFRSAPSLILGRQRWTIRMLIR